MNNSEPKKVSHHLAPVPSQTHQYSDFENAKTVSIRPLEFHGDKSRY